MWIPNVKGVLRAYQENHVHHRPQLGGQPTYAYQKLQRTHGNVGDPLQYSRDKKFVQHLYVLCKYFMYKMQKSDDLLDHINKVKTLVK